LGRRAGVAISERGRVASFLASATVRIGYVYEGSPTIAGPGTELPTVDYAAPYRQTTRPGARAPHAWLADGRSTVDLFGAGFTLLRLGAAPPDASAIVAAAARRGMPLDDIALPDPAIAELYELPLVLVRPDGHVAWRGTAAPDDALALIDRVRGAPH
jgi:hypothetical protein